MNLNKEETKIRDQLLNQFARIEGYEKKAYSNWKDYRLTMHAEYKTGMYGPRAHPLPRKDLIEMASIAAKHIAKKG